MKLFQAVWITFLASLEPALSLQCYTCDNPVDLVDCVSITNCSVEATACKTTVLSVDSGYPFFGNVTGQKSCAEECVPSEPDTIGENHPDYCCFTDLCNLSAKQPPVTTLSAMAFVAATTFAILWTRI